MKEVVKILQSTFKIPDFDGTDKVVALDEAIRKEIRPGDEICIGSTHNYPVAAVFELIRQFWKKKPAFSVVTAGMLTPSILLIYARLVKRVAADLFGDVFFTPGPNPVVQKAVRNEKIEFEHWSVLTHALQLMAGAMGVNFIPTNSLVGSSMAEANAKSFKVIEDPFDKNRQAAVIKAVNPDICFMHALAADPTGNAIFVPPYGEDVYGAFASKRGVVLTVEKIVSTDFIRKNSHFVRIPGYVVKTVSEVPLGAHPWGFGNIQIPSLESYADDSEFQYDLRMACRSSKRLGAWCKKWILECASHEDYLKRLGPRKILYLKGKAKIQSYEEELRPLINKAMTSEKYTSVEMAIISAARKIRDYVVRKGYRTLLAGLGMGSLAAWVAYYLLKDDKYKDIDLMVEMGLYGYAPRPGDPFTFNHSNYSSCKMLSNKITTMGVLATGCSQRCMGILGGGQIDKRGNLNSTLIMPDQFITGSGGANDLASNSSEVMVVMRQSRSRFVDAVDYITCPGTRVKSVVSDLGVFEKAEGNDELVLTGYYRNGISGANAKGVSYVTENCAWELNVSHMLQEIAPPLPKELIILRLLDPHRYWLGKS